MMRPACGRIMSEGWDYEIWTQLQVAGLLVDWQRSRYDLSGIVSGSDLLLFTKLN